MMSVRRVASSVQAATSSLIATSSLTVTSSLIPTSFASTSVPFDALDTTAIPGSHSPDECRRRAPSF